MVHHALGKGMFINYKLKNVTANDYLTPNDQRFH
jgi:hypothetical protein